MPRHFLEEAVARDFEDGARNNSYERMLVYPLSTLFAKPGVRT